MAISKPIYHDIIIQYTRAIVNPYSKFRRYKYLTSFATFCRQKRQKLDVMSVKVLYTLPNF